MGRIRVKRVLGDGSSDIEDLAFTHRSSREPDRVGPEDCVSTEASLKARKGTRYLFPLLVKSEKHRRRDPVRLSRMVVGGGVFGEDGLGLAFKDLINHYLNHGKGEAYDAVIDIAS